jgi:hypothetical protein
MPGLNDQLRLLRLGQFSNQQNQDQANRKREELFHVHYSAMGVAGPVIFMKAAIESAKRTPRK